MRVVDLFAGTGAFSYVFEKYNCECVYANDFYKESQKIYDANHKNKLTLKDINAINLEDIPEHDILCAGFPCQPFSVAGKQEGFKDPRSNVFWTLLKIIEYRSPKWLVLENVRNLKSHDNSKTFSVIKQEIENLGYYFYWTFINTSDTGVPQNRERIYMICIHSSKTKASREYFIDYFTNSIQDSIKKCTKRPISDFLEDSTNIPENIPDKYYYTEKSPIYKSLEESVIKKDTFYQYRRVYVRENKTGKCPTLTANMGTGGHNVPIILDSRGIRKLTPRECFNLQGFPKEYSLPTVVADSHLYKLAGNAVSIPVLRIIADAIIKCPE